MSNGSKSTSACSRAAATTASKRKRNVEASKVEVPALSQKCSTRATKHFKKHDISLAEGTPAELETELPDIEHEVHVLKQQKKAMQSAARRASYEVKKCRQKQQRLRSKASKLSNSELLAVYLARKEASEAKANKLAATRSSNASQEE